MHVMGGIVSLLLVAQAEYLVDVVVFQICILNQSLLNSWLLFAVTVDNNLHLRINRHQDHGPCSGIS